MCTQYCFKYPECKHTCLLPPDQQITVCADFLAAFLDPNQQLNDSTELCLGTNSSYMILKGCCPSCGGNNTIGLTFDQAQYDRAVQAVMAKVEEQHALYQSRKAAAAQGQQAPVSQAVSMRFSTAIHKS